ncbi:MAG: hypothetical protein AAF546_05910 [Verrucomicrobiota bacterium]
MHLRLVLLLLPSLDLFGSTEAFFTAKETAKERLRAEKTISCESAVWVERESLLRDLIAVGAKRIARVEAEPSDTEAGLYAAMVPYYLIPEDAGCGVLGVGGWRWMPELLPCGATERSETAVLHKQELGIELFAASTDQLEKLFGRRQYNGKALSPDGGIYGGRFPQVGPLLYFFFENGELAELFEEAQLLDAHVLPLDEGMASRLAPFIESRKGDSPINPTLDEALAVEATKS